jgi:hypothetical protein
MTQGAPSSEALQSALNVIEAKAHFDAPERLVQIRAREPLGRPDPKPPFKIVFHSLLEIAINPRCAGV